MCQLSRVIYSSGKFRWKNKINMFLTKRTNRLAVVETAAAKPKSCPNYELDIKKGANIMKDIKARKNKNKIR